MDKLAKTLNFKNLTRYQSILKQFEALPPSATQIKLPSPGYYKANIVNYDNLPMGFVTGMLVSFLWRGTIFREDNTCTQVIRRPFNWIMPAETGTVELAESVLDKQECVKVSS